MTVPPADSIVIAVDGGGSKTDGVALDLAGNVISRARRPGSSVHVTDFERSADIVDSLVAEIRAGAGNRPVLQANVYLSGLDLPVEVAAFAETLQPKDWATGVTGNAVIVDNDMFALLRAGSEAPNAVAVVCGTGINCVGVREDGEHARFAALGMISGDWGGGSEFGQQAVWHAARAMDGRGPSTSLTLSVPAHLGVPDVQSVIEGFHFGRLSDREFPRMAPLVLDAADSGDPVASSILDRQAEEIVDLAVAALRRLELMELAVPVILGGGVLATGNARLLGGISAGLAARAPMAHVELVRSRPVLGAALLTLESVGASAAALETARLALQHADELSAL